MLPKFKKLFSIGFFFTPGFNEVKKKKDDADEGSGKKVNPGSIVREIIDYKVVLVKPLGIAGTKHFVYGVS